MSPKISVISKENKPKSERQRIKRVIKALHNGITQLSGPGIVGYSMLKHTQEILIPLHYSLSIFWMILFLASIFFFCRTAKASSVNSPVEIVMYKFCWVNNKHKKTFAHELSTLTWFDLLDRNRLIIQIDDSVRKGTYCHACCPKFDPYGTNVE